MNFNYNLTEGALRIIMNGGDVPDPIMQILGSKKMSNSDNSEKERYRILLSDGKYKISFAMLATQINEKIGVAAIQNYSIIKLKRYITSLINTVGRGDTRVLLILDAGLIASGDKVGHVIGCPVELPDDKTKVSNSQSSSNSMDSVNTTVLLNNKVYTSNNFIKNNNARGDNAVPSLNTEIISPISSLNPFHNNWVIKARITNKTSVRTWSNSRGEGTFFSVDLMDDSGEIRCTAFKELVDKFFNYLEVDKIYYFSKCQLKPTNKQFCTLKNEYEMTLINESVVEECLTNDESIPQIKYDFISIDKVGAMEVGTLVDVIGVCKSVSDLQMFVSKSSNRELKKREVTLVDQSKSSIALILWGSQAESFDGTNNPVVVLKGAKIGEFGGGKNLSTVVNTQIKINPKIPECFRIKGWFNLEGHQAEIRNISERTSFGNVNAPWLNFKDTQGLGQSDRGDYYQNMGTIIFARSENSIYKSCPLQDCNKKVVDLQNGMYRCEKCNREYPNFKYCLLASMNLSDPTGNQWVTLFSAEAEKILGKTAEEIGQLFETDPDEAAKFFEDANFKQFIFKCRAKMETFNDEQRLKTIVVRVEPVNYGEYSSYLVEKIEKFLCSK